MDERIRHLLRVAARAEGEGDLRVARVFRRMAEDARIVTSGNSEPSMQNALGGCCE